MNIAQSDLGVNVHFWLWHYVNTHLKPPNCQNISFFKRWQRWWSANQVHLIISAWLLLTLLLFLQKKKGCSQFSYVYVLYLNLYVVYTVSFMSCSSAHIWTLCYSSHVKKKSMYHFICISYFPVFWCEWRVNRSYCEQLFCAYALFQMALASVKQNDKWNNVVMFCVEDLPEKI